jgi:hypothetical protein
MVVGYAAHRSEHGRLLTPTLHVVGLVLPKVAAKGPAYGLDICLDVSPDPDGIRLAQLIDEPISGNAIPGGSSSTPCSSH